jgi:hypothetical protein
LPACNDRKVKDVVVKGIRACSDAFVKEPYDMRSDDPHMRWCVAPWVILPYPGLGGSCVRLVYTIEWVNEREARWWVQPRSQERRICIDEKGREEHVTPTIWQTGFNTQKNPGSYAAGVPRRPDG